MAPDVSYADGLRSEILINFRVLSTGFLYAFGIGRPHVTHG
jgi:hypothetical protein